MTAKPIKSNSLLTPATPKPRGLDGLAKKILLKKLAHLQMGKLHIVDGQEHYHFGQESEISGLTKLSVRIDVLHPQFYSDVVFGGSIGAGEAYMSQYFECDNLTALIRLMVRNQSLLDNIEKGFAKLTIPLQKFFHFLHRNTQSGSKKNIAAHYDLGNDFFELMLDDTMMYSSGIYSKPTEKLRQASINKLEAICRKLDLTERDHLLEIGTGWGGFAVYAAKNYGCQVTTTTISDQQYLLALERVKKAGLQDKVTVLKQDYRDLQGQYDKLVSIEMIEAVGYQFYDTFFSQCARLLKPEGMMLLQAITIVDQRYESAIKSVDFIQRYIFPGSCIPSSTAILQSLTRSTDLRIYDLHDIGASYAKTLAAWRKNVHQYRTEIIALGYPEKFLRMWDFYLCYCEGGFAERALSDVQMLLIKPMNRRDNLLARQ